MHHYKHHIGDFRSATVHLSDAEELAYRRMLELYYDLEGPLPADIAWIARRVRSTPDTVQAVLNDFFAAGQSGEWHQQRCDAELAEYRAACERASKNGRRGGRPPNQPETDSEPTRFPVGSDSVPKSKAPQPPTPVPQPPVPSTQPPTGEGSGEGGASPSAGDGERGGADPREVEAVFALLAATSLRSHSRNRRTILHEHATALVADGMGSDQARRLIAKARAESNSDPGGLLATWMRPGAWREQWDEILNGKNRGKVRGLVAGVAMQRRAQ